MKVKNYDWGETYLLIALILAPVAIIIFAANGVQFDFVDRPLPFTSDYSGSLSNFEPSRRRGAALAFGGAAIFAAVATIPLLNSTRWTTQSVVRLWVLTVVIVFLTYPGALSFWMADAMNETRLWRHPRDAATWGQWPRTGPEWREMMPYLARSAYSIAAALGCIAVLAIRHGPESGTRGHGGEGDHWWADHLPTGADTGHGDRRK